MKILVLNGSPKREHSDTMHITRAFLDGVQEAAQPEIRTIHVIDRHIGYCTGCFACMKNGGLGRLHRKSRRFEPGSTRRLRRSDDL